MAAAEPDVSPEIRRLRSVNLNLLPVLGSLLRRRNVSRAAKELHLSQPAASAALAKLRELFADELLVPRGRSMEPTMKARRLLEAIEPLLGSIAGVLGEPPFDPAAATRRFTLASADFVSALVAPAAARRFAAEAPRASLHAFNASTRSADELLVGAIDLVIAPEGLSEFASLRRGLDDGSVLAETVFEDRLVCVVSRRDPTIGEKLDRRTYLERPHAAFALEPGLHASLEIEGLAAQKLEQRDRIRLGSFILLPFVTAASDAIAVLPSYLARLFAEPLGLRILDPPVRFRPIRLRMLWSRSQEADPAHRWFRAVVREAIAASAAEAGIESTHLVPASRARRSRRARRST